MGILDDVLRPHLEAVTKAFMQNEDLWQRQLEAKKANDIKLEQKAEMICTKRDNAADRFRERGNTWFKVKEFCEAASLYTESIASAKDGPLASLAYFNR